jgi:hypothetical protein
MLNISPGRVFGIVCSAVVFAVVFSAEFLLAQSSGIDLNGSVLQSNASRPLNDLPGSPILRSIQPLLDDQLRKGQVGQTVYSVEQDEATGFGPYKSLTALYTDLTCRADSVLIGSATASVSHFSSSGSSIYSDYDFVISAVLRTNASSSPKPGQHVVFTHPGGLMPATGGFVRFEHQAFPSLVQGNAYLVFVNRIQNNGAYELASLQSVGYVFSTLFLDPTNKQWYLSRAAYKKRQFPDLNSDVLTNSITAAKCSG